MYRTMLKSKIHRATVTQADLHYVGSVTVDEDLMDAADLLAGEQVAIVDVTNGARLETYVIAGPRGTGILGINGAAAHLVHPGDLVILIAYAQVDDAEARRLVPRIVFVDADNRISGTGHDPAEALPGLLRGDRAHPHSGSYDDHPALDHPALDHAALDGPARDRPTRTDARSADPVLVW